MSPAQRQGKIWAGSLIFRFDLSAASHDPANSKLFTIVI
jgi:hypothetical protein